MIICWRCKNYFIFKEEKVMAIDLGTLQTQNNGGFVMNLEKGFVMDL